MESILKFAKELLPLLQLYPAWAKVLFMITSVACVISVGSFVVLYPGVEKRRNEQIVSSDLSINLGVLTTAREPTPETHEEAALESHKKKGGGVEVFMDQPVGAEAGKRGIKSSEFGGRDDWDVSYAQEKTDIGMRIRPSAGYLSKLAAGGPISDVSFWYTPFHIDWPVIDLKVVNNSAKTIFFTDAVFQVDDSKLDSTPILLLPTDKSVSNSQHILLINEGWGSIDACLLRFNLVSPGAPVVFDGPFQNEIDVGKFSDDTNVDISNAFVKAGVNNTAIGALQWTSRSGDSITVVGNSGHERTLSKTEYEQEQRKAFGPFPDNVAVALGEIVYSGGGQQQRRVKFSTRVHVMDENRVGAPAPPTAQYDVFLRVEGTNYTVDVPVSQAIKAGEFDRFTFRVATSKSSRHRFRLKLLYNGGEVFSSTPIVLEIFLPQSAAHLFARQ